MMHGLVNISYEAMLRLVIETEQQKQHSIDAIISTTFGGFLGLPHSIIQKLDLSLLSPDTPESNAEGAYQATVLWDNERRLIPVNVVVGEPVLGMALLQGYLLQIQVTQHGIVTVDRIR